MDVGMQLKILSPGVQNSDVPEFCLQLAGGTDIQQGFAARIEEKVIQQLFVLESQRSNRTRHGEDDVEIMDLQELGLAGGNPLFPGWALALWAVAVPTRVVRVLFAAAPIALVHVATEDGGAAVDDVPHDFPLQWGDGEALGIAESVATKDVGHV
jgi:hypothetical protein